MENQTSAQSDTAEPQVSEGIQKRIDELTAARRQAEEALKERDRQLMENTATMAQLAMQAQIAQRPAPQAPVDPLAQFKDQLDPVMTQAIQAAVRDTRQQMEALYAPQFAHQASQLAGMQVQAEASAIVGLPREVAVRAAQLAAEWRSRGLNWPGSDAINFALGEYQRGQLAKAAPVAGYNPALQGTPTIQGYPPPPPAQARALPHNFDQLSRAQQNAALDASGSLDQPLA